jgi:GxxExxY protein
MRSPVIAVFVGNSQDHAGPTLAMSRCMDTTELDRISYLTIQSAIEIHKKLGPGLLENVYRRCMIYELRARRLEVATEIKVPVRYKDLVLDGFYRLDLLVNDAVVIELKAVEAVHPVHRAQVLSYLRVMDKQLGLLINFHVEQLVLGVDRIINKFGWPDSQACKSSEVATDKQ